MALAATIQWEVRTTGNALNGGGYKSDAGTTDYSQQDSAQLSVADADASGTTNLHSTTGGFTAQMVGNVVQISGGTLTPGFYEIAAYVDTNNVTLDTTPGTGTGSTAKVGGALDNITPILAKPVPKNIVWIQSGSYSLGATTDISAAGTTAGGWIRWRGYTGSRAVATGTDRPLFSGSASTAYEGLIKLSGDYNILENVRVDHVDKGGNDTGIKASGTRCVVSNCHVSRFGYRGIDLTTGATAVGCEVTDSGGSSDSAIAVYISGRVLYNYIHDVTATTGAIYLESPTNAPVIGNVIDTPSAHGVNVYDGTSVILANSFYGCGTYGIRFYDAVSQMGSICMFNVVEGSTSGGMRCQTDLSTWGATPVLDYNALYESTNYSQTPAGTNDVDLSATAFSGAASGDFAPTNASVKGITFAWPGGLTTGYPDIGAAQAQPAAGSSRLLAIAVL